MTVDTKGNSTGQELAAIRAAFQSTGITEASTSQVTVLNSQRRGL